jgi:hypothetical protein
VTTTIETTAIPIPVIPMTRYHSEIKVQWEQLNKFNLYISARLLGKYRFLVVPPPNIN